MTGNLFDRLAKGRPVETAIKQPPSDAQKMLDWLLRWPKPTVSACEIYQYAPRSARPNKETAIKNVEVLVRHGWLAACKPRHSNYRIWEITRKPVIHPIIEE